MSFTIKATDFAIYFWYAENHMGDNFLMVLRKRPAHWRLDWRFCYKRGGKFLNWLGRDRKRSYFALSGLQTLYRQVVHEGQGVFQQTGEEFPLRRINQRIDGSGADLFRALQKHGLAHIKEIKNR